MNDKPIVRLWYCKADKKSGKPIIVQDLEKGTTYNTNKIEYKNVTVRMSFNNAVSKAKASGATTILEIYQSKTTELLKEIDFNTVLCNWQCDDDGVPFDSELYYKVKELMESIEK